MNTSSKEKLRYRFEKYLNKGGTSVFMSLLIVFLVGFALVIGIRYLIITLFPNLNVFNDFWSDIWVSFLQITDPGAVAEDTDSSPWLKLIAIITGFIGIVIFSMLIAFITTSLENMFHEFRKGRGKVIEKGHTIMLGWNERTVDIIRELIIANESEKKAIVVILAKEEKEEMDDLLAKRLPDTKTTRIITTSGDYANMNELNRVNITEAKSVLLMAACSEGAEEDDKIDSDIQTIKAIMAIVSCQNGTNKIPIISEIFNEEKREIISYFEDDKIIALDSWDIMGKLLVQTSLTSGLEIVYNEMLSFDGCEIYFYKSNWNNVEFGELPLHFKDGIPLGIYTEEKELILRPGNDYKLKNTDQILILAEDDSTINFQPQKIYSAKDISLSSEKMEAQSKNILVLGWHNVAEIFVRESADYLVENSTFDIVINSPTQEDKDRVVEMQKAYPQFKLNLIKQNPLKLEGLTALKPFDYDSVLILSQNTSDYNAERIDSDTLIILLFLRKIKKEINADDSTHIITQVLNSENQDIITQTDVDDFIISNKLITMILAQLSEEPEIRALYDDLFSEDGSEIYVKPARLYFDKLPQKCSFADIIKLASKRDEICLGVRKGSLSKSPDDNFGVQLNIPKDELVEIDKDDYLVVLSEDYM
jgi:Castor and Pollux, part of voltage-gated ion channel/Calcium-activated potassium channel slowpoke-like RCK domain